MLLTTIETLHRLGMAIVLTLVLLACQHLSATNSQSFDLPSVEGGIVPMTAN